MRLLPGFLDTKSSSCAVEIQFCHLVAHSVTLGKSHHHFDLHVKILKKYVKVMDLWLFLLALPLPLSSAVQRGLYLITYNTITFLTSSYYSNPNRLSKEKMV